MVVAKAPGMLVHRQADSDLDTWLLLQRLRDQLGQYLYPVHRLDRCASGCVAFALTPERAREIQAALIGGGATKQYLALVRGEVPGAAEIRRPLRDEGAIREARTTLTPLAACPEPRCSLLSLQPHTGRFHQLRRHLRGHNHPILGDQEHGDRPVNRAWAARGLMRLQLHALRLRLPLPDGEIAAECPLYDDMQAVLAALPFYGEVCATEPLIAAPPLPTDPSILPVSLLPVPQNAAAP